MRILHELQRLGRRSTRKRKPHDFRRARLGVEQLEDRRLLNAEEVFPGNNTIDTAYNLGLYWGTGNLAFNQASFHAPGDVDWFRFSTLSTPSGGHRVVVDDFGLSTPNAARLAFRLYYVDSTSGQLFQVPEQNRLFFNEGVLGADTSFYWLGGLPATEFYVETAPNPLSTVAVSYNVRLDVPAILPDFGESGPTNNSFSTALDLGAINGSPLPGFVYHAATKHDFADEDWYRFTIGDRGGAEHFVAIDFFHSQNTNLRLEFYDALGFPIGISAGPSDRHQISLANLPAGTYHARVVGEAPATTSPLYWISINAPLLPTVDSFETTNGPNNDHPLTATNLGGFQGVLTLGATGDALTGANPNNDFLSIHRLPSGFAEIDYFRFEVTSTGGPADFLQIDFDHTRGDLDLYLETYNATFNLASVVAHSTGVGNTEAIPLNGLPQGVYYAVVRGAYGAVNPSYRLSVGLGGGHFPADDFDRSAPNNNKNFATRLGPVSGVRHLTQRLSVHSDTDEDWYQIQLESTGRSAHGVFVNFDGQAGDVDVELYDAVSQFPIAASRSISSQEFISFDGLTAGTYYLRVFGYQGDTNPRYELTILGPGDDIHDQPGMTNNTAVTATPLGTIIGEYMESHLSITEADHDWYEFTTTATAGTGQTVAVFFDQQEGDLDLFLYDESGQTLLGKSTGVGNSAAIDLTRLDLGSGPHAALPAGTYKLRVEGKHSDTENSNYSLRIGTPALDGRDRFDRDGLSNNSRAAAVDLDDESNRGQAADGQIVFDDSRDPLTIHTGDVDWFQLHLVGNETPNHFAVLSLDHTQGDLDLDLYYEGETTPRRVSRGIAGVHSIDLSDLGDEGTYYLRVVGFVGATNAAYQLSVSAPGEAKPDWIDLMAENDERSTSTNLGTIDGIRTRENLSLDDGDEDWFQLELASTPIKGHAISIAFDHFLGDLQLQLYRQGDNTAVRQSTTVDDVENISLAGLGVGTYFVRVFGRDASDANPNYTLVIDGPQGTMGDRAEKGTGNDTAATAFDLRVVDGPNVFDPFSIDDGGDVDWYRFETIADGHAGNSISIAFDPVLGDLDLYLYADNGQTLLGSSETAQGVETIRIEDVTGSLPEGEYKLLVRGHRNATHPRYILSIDAPSTRLAADEYEDNDESSQATDLREVEGGLVLPALSIDRPGDDDYFTFSTSQPANAGHQVEIFFDHTQGDLQLSVTAPLVEASPLVSQTDGNREVISLDGFPATDFEVIVSGADGATNQSYDLVITAPTTARPDFVEERTVSDATINQPVYDLRRVAGTLSLGGLSINESGDIDSYVFNLEAGAAPGDVVRVDTNRHDGPLTLRLRSIGNSILAEVTQTTSNSIELPLLGDGYAIGAGEAYRIEVVGAAPGGTNPDYTLSIMSQPTAVADRYERNDELGTAYDLGILTRDAAITQSAFRSQNFFNTLNNLTLGFLPRFSQGICNPFCFQDALSNRTNQVFQGDVSILNNMFGSLNSFLSLSGSIPQFAPVFSSLSGSGVFQQTASLPFGSGFANTPGGGFLGTTNDVIRNQGAITQNSPFAFQPNAFRNTFAANPFAFPAAPTFSNPFSFGGSFGFPSLNNLGGLGFLGSSSVLNNINQFLQPKFGRQASLIEPVLTGSITPADVDVYRIELSEPDSTADFVAIAFQHAAGDLRLRLTDQLAGPVADDRILETSDGRSDVERISLAGLPAGTYHLLVDSALRSTSNASYVLIITSGAGDADLGDLAEENDSPIAAHDLRTVDGQRLLSGLSIHEAGNDDWFQFEIPSGTVADAVANVRIEFDHGQGDLDLELYTIGSTTTPLAVSGSNRDFEQIDLVDSGGNLLPAGEYLLRVFGFEEATNPRYDLIVAGPEKRIEPDRLEPNNVSSRAISIDDLASTHHVEGLTLHTGDVDWFEFTVPTGVTLSDAHAIVLDFDNPSIASTIWELEGLTTGVHRRSIELPAGAAERRYTLHSNLPSNATDADNDWTVFVYMTASDLAEFAFEDINEMEEAAARLPAGVSLVALWDQSQLGQQFATGNGSQAAWGTTGRAVIRPDTNPDIIATPFELLPEQNTGDPEVALVDFVQWGVAAAPAEHYGLVLWNHGQGVEGFNFDNADGGTPDAATASELRAALADLASQNIRFDLLAFDSCNMAMLELTDAFGDSADVIVASQENIAGAGFTYDTMFLSLLARPSAVTAEELASGIVESFEARYSGNIRGADTLSAVKIAGVPTALSAFTSAALDATSTQLFDVFRDARDAATSFVNHPEYRDLGQFARFVADAPGVPSSVANAASTLAETIAESVIAKTSDQRDTTGVSIYLPAHGAELRHEYLQEFSLFLNDTGWGSFLNEFVTGDTLRPASLKPDWAESNSLAARAFDLHQMQGAGNLFSGLSLHDRVDRDWFRFEIVASGSATDRVVAIRETASGSWTLGLYSAAGNQLIEMSSGSATTLQVSLQGQPAGEFLVQISAPGVLVPRYDLAIDAPPSPQTSDWAAPNHVASKAFALGTIARTSVFAGLVADQQQDWFTFQTPRNEQAEATTGILMIHSAAGVSLSASLSRNDGSPVSYEGTAALRIPYDSGTAANYELSVALAEFGGAQSYVIQFEPTPDNRPMPGDYNGDRTVDDLDYDMWKSSYRQSGAGLAADGNNNGTVDIADYTIWRDNRGSSDAMNSFVVPAEAHDLALTQWQSNRDVLPVRRHEPRASADSDVLPLVRVLKKPELHGVGTPRDRGRQSEVPFQKHSVLYRWEHLVDHLAESSLGRYYDSDGITSKP